MPTSLANEDQVVCARRTTFAVTAKQGRHGMPRLAARVRSSCRWKNFEFIEVIVLVFASM
jgi:hypothetical protein